VETFEMIAKTFQGLEEVLAKELIDLGANDVQIGRRMVSFTGDKAMMYKANFRLRTAIRVLKPIKRFKASDADQIYETLKPFEWECYMDVNTSFAVDAVVYSEEFRHSKFVAYRVKDAIADHFRDREGKRPSVQVTNPDLLFHIHIADDQCTLSLDSSGESLHRRGYRQDAVAAPLNEVLAAGMIMLSGWQGECDFIDPMCGSGTLLIEAALVAKGIAPGVFRKEFAFEKWTDFDAELFDSIYNDDSTEREFTHHIYGYDNDWKAVNIAKANVRSAGMMKYIDVEHRDIEDFTQPAEPAIMITNPPYGERLKPDDLYDLYRLIGNRLKNSFQGNQAWIISYKEECFNKIGLKPSTIVPLFNGALPCELRKYELFSGRFSEFRESGEQLDKSDRPFKERRPLHLRQQAVADKKEGTDNKSDESFGFENREEEQAYRSKLERHNEFDRLQQARERKERRAKEAEDRERTSGERSDGYRRNFHQGGQRDFGKSGARNYRRDSDGQKSGRSNFKGDGFKSDGSRSFKSDGSRGFDRNGGRAGGGKSPFRDGGKGFSKGASGRGGNFKKTNYRNNKKG